ncbi:MAG: response regulator [Calditrichia bacterium]
MEKSDVHILVVEDEEIIRLMFRQSFESWGFHVDVAENGKEAFEKCLNKTYHIVVTDLNMPVMDGMELLKRVKSKWPFMEVIVITGFATIESAIEAMKLGAYDFILKPVNFDHVQFTINKSFQKIKSQAENAELRQLNNQLMELNELKDKFLYITNHEIRTPLTIIKGYLDVLHSLIPESDPDVSEILDILENTTSELHDMVDRMHTLEGLERSKVSVPTRRLDLKNIISKVYHEMVGLYNSRNIDLKIFLDKRPLQVRGDYRQVRLVLRELLQNALKFTADSGKVRVRLELKDDEIHYTVKDTGVGIPFDKQDIIFERFYEIQDVINHRTSKREFMGGGLGIGLSLIREIVNSMGGRIMLESEPGNGSLFRIILPYYHEIAEDESDGALREANKLQNNG